MFENCELYRSAMFENCEHVVATANQLILRILVQLIRICGSQTGKADAFVRVAYAFLSRRPLVRALSGGTAMVASGAAENN
jgi:hypothetical protein